MNTKITSEDVEKALQSLEANLVSEDTEVVSKASEQDLDQPEGADLGNPAKDKMSDEAKSKKPVKKSDDEDADDMGDEEGEDEGDEEIEKKKAYQKAKKSFDEMPEEIETKIDVSNFLKSLVDHTGNTIDALREYVAKSDVAQGARYDALESAVVEIQKSQAKIGVVLKAICQQIGVVKSAPVHTGKADKVVKSESAERTFSSGLETEGQEKTFKSLSDNAVVAKSQISDALCELVKKGEATDMDVIGFESGNYIRPEIATKLKTVLQ